MPLQDASSSLCRLRERNGMRNPKPAMTRESNRFQSAAYWTTLICANKKDGANPAMFDFLKIIAVVSALVYLNAKVKPKVSSTNYWTMNTGLSLLLFAATLDFTDGIKALNYVPIIGQRAPHHDLLEDQFGDIPGFALFALGALREIMSKDDVPAAA